MRNTSLTEEEKMGDARSSTSSDNGESIRKINTNRTQIPLLHGALWNTSALLDGNDETSNDDIW